LRRGKVEGKSPKKKKGLICRRGVARRAKEVLCGGENIPMLAHNLRTGKGKNASFKTGRGRIQVGKKPCVIMGENLLHDVLTWQKKGGKESPSDGKFLTKTITTRKKFTKAPVGSPHAFKNKQTVDLTVN